MKDAEKSRDQLINELIELRKSERYFHSILQNIHEDILVIDRDYKITDVNKTFLDTAGREREDVIGHHCYEISHGYNEPCDEMDEECSMREVFETDEPRRCRHEHIRADGSKVWVDILLSPWKDEQGNVTHVVQAVRDVSDLITVEEELRTSEANYQSIFNAVNDAIFIHDMKTGEFVDVNERACELLGYSYKELLSLGVGSISAGEPPHTQEDAIQWIKKAAEDGPQLLEWMVKDKRGRLFWVEVNLKWAIIGGKDRILAVVRDISERRRVEEVLRESEIRYRMLFEKAGDAIFIMEAEGKGAGKIVATNQAAAEMHDYTVDELLALNIKDLDTPDFAKQVPARIQRMFAGEWIKEEITHRKKDGTVFPVEMSAGMLELGDHKYILGFDRDITERKRAEEALRESVVNFKALAENANDGILIAAGEGVHVYANKRTAEITGYSIAELLEISLRSLVAPDEVEKIAERLNRRLAGEDPPRQYETIFIRKSGETFPVELSVARSEWEGRPASIIIIHDIAERKRAEEVLRQRETELEIRANELEELNSALRVLLRKRDEDQSELEEKVLSTVKELVLPYMERLKRSGLDPKQMAYLNIVESNLADIVSPFARKLSSIFLGLTPTEINVATLIKEGKDTKEIAELLNLSARTVEFHRQNIRRKIGIKHKKANLRSHLLSI
jgi:PAS domain S-box-containing protein